MQQICETYEHFRESFLLLWQQRIYATFTAGVEARLAGLKYSSSGATQFYKKTSHAAVSNFNNFHRTFLYTLSQLSFPVLLRFTL